MIRVLHTLPDLHVGGVASLLRRILQNFNNPNFEHHLCYFGENETLLSEFHQLAVIIHKINHKGLVSYPITIYQFNKLVIAENIDIIHNHLFLDRTVTGLCSFFNRAKIITSIHTTNTQADNSSLKIKMQGRFEDILGRISSDTFLSVSDTVKKVAIQSRIVPKNKVKTIYSGVKIPEKLDRKIISPIRLISVGRMVESKGFFDLIELMNILTDKIDVQLNILGDGPLRKQLEERVKKFNLETHINFIGFSEKVHDYLEDADIFVSCSKEEGFGLSVVEAMSYSLPVFTYSIPIFQEISGSENTMILTDIGNIRKMSEKILNMVKNPVVYQSYSNLSYKRAKNAFDIKETANKYLRLYYKVSSKND